jgi:2-polyprenyl-6-methoxyphenol hydroxylase-like FAD-dependent oxidoreductase
MISLVRTPVLIVGGGPVGLALAGDLAWRGLPSLLVERGDGRIGQPKMDLVGPRTMEFCRRWGIVGAVEASPYNRDHPQDYAWISQFDGGWEFGREPFPSMREERAPPQSPQKRERCPQDMFDPILRGWAESLPGTTLRHGTELIGFEEVADGVRTTLRDVATGAETAVQADYLIGCDGAASTVRQGLGITMSGNAALTYTTNAIFRCPDFWQLHSKRKGYRFILIGPEGTWGTIVAINGHDRFRFSFVGDGTPRALEEAEVRRLITRAMGRPFDFEILSIMPWVRRELVADSYGTQRVFLAGDAAHLTSPTGGFGMNMGIQDSVDLGWKLEATLRGWGGPALLASYQPERRPVAVRNVREATGNLQRMLAPRSKLSPEVFAEGPEGQAARRDFGDAYTAAMKREWFTLHIHLGYRYDDSPIVVPDGTPELPEEISTYTQTARPGARAPHVWLAQGRSTLDMFGRGFVLLRFDAAAATARFAAAAAARGVPLAVVDIDNAEARALYARALVLVRPDGHVAWRDDHEPDDALAVIDRIRGAAAPACAHTPKNSALERMA